MLPYQTVVCALDVEPGSARALVRAADLAERSHAALHLLHIRPHFRARLAHAGAEAHPFEAAVRAYVNEALGADDAFDVLAPVVHVAHGEAAADGILRYASAAGADLLVLGTHARQGLGHLLLGSVAADVLRRSAVPVLVVPDQAARTAPGPDAPVLVGTDFSAHTAEALAHARRAARAYAAPVALAHVRDAPAETLVDPHARGPLAPPSGMSSRVEAHAALRDLIDAHDLGDGVARHVVPGRPAEELVALAHRSHAGLVVVGTHGRRGWDRLRLGSVAEGVARRAECPVLVVPTPALRPPAEAEAVAASAA
jgi:nucleotide-binding universal stress UspA family protein